MKMWYICKMECYLALKDKKIMKSVGKWMDSETLNIQ